MSLKISNYVSLIEHLMQESVSAQDLAALTGLHLDTTRDFLKEMHRRKLVHIAGWDTRFNRRIKLPMYRLGEGVDQPKPKRLPATLVTQRWRERQRVKAAFDPFFAMCRPDSLAVPARRVRAEDQRALQPSAKP